MTINLELVSDENQPLIPGVEVVATGTDFVIIIIRLAKDQRTALLLSSEQAHDLARSVSRAAAKVASR